MRKYSRLFKRTGCPLRPSAHSRYLLRCERPVLGNQADRESGGEHSFRPDEPRRSHIQSDAGRFIEDKICNVAGRPKSSRSAAGFPVRREATMCSALKLVSTLALRFNYHSPWRAQPLPRDGSDAQLRMSCPAHH